MAWKYNYFGSEKSRSDNFRATGIFAMSPMAITLVQFLVFDYVDLWWRLVIKVIFAIAGYLLVVESYNIMVRRDKQYVPRIPVAGPTRV